jgi:hypothetical protein
MLGALARIERSLYLVDEWVVSHNYKGYEPFDGLSTYLFPMTFGNRFLCQVLQQGVRRFPANLRPLLGIRPLDSTKGRAYMAWGYLKNHLRNGEDKEREKALNCLDWLDKNKSPQYPQHSWGNHFYYVSRAGIIRKYEPTIVWTGLIGQVYLEAYELFWNRRHLEIIDSISRWIMALPRERTSQGLCLSYVMPEVSSIHNSNMIGAAFLAGAAKVLNEPNLLDVARSAMEYSCSRQLDGGAWYYGEEPKFHWIDVFHTGYNLDSLKRYQSYSGDTSFAGILSRGLEYFIGRFFEPSGRIRYYSDKTPPIDIQCASQAIDSLVLFSDFHDQFRQLAIKSALWYIDNMQAADGHFYFRRYPCGIVNRTPMIHWGQATMYKALTNLALNIEKR